MLELVLKTPKNKPPFIGILFDTEEEAATLNQKLPNEHRHANYELMIESISLDVDITITSTDFNFKYKYVNVRCDWPKFITWLNKIIPGSAYNFSHLTRKSGEDIVVRTIERQKLFVLRVSAIKVYN